MSFLLYLLIRLIQYYFTQRYLRQRTNDLIESENSLTTILVQIHNLNEFDILQPLILKNEQKRDNYINEPPPSYKE